MKFQCHISLKISRKISNIHTSRENKIMNPYIDHPVSTIITFFFLEGGATAKNLEITGWVLKSPQFHFIGNRAFFLKGYFLGINSKGSFWFGPLLNCSLGHWSFHLCSQLCCRQLLISLRDSFSINRAPSLHACGGVRLGRLHIHSAFFLCFLILTCSDFTEGSRNYKKREKLKISSKFDWPFGSRAGPCPRNYAHLERDALMDIPRC